MDTERKGLWFQMAVGIIIALFTLHLVGISNDYPHYFMADMDWPTSLDAVLIHSDMLPDHINHPGFGMYLLHHFTTRVGHWFGGVSALTLGELDDSLNAFLPMAELTGFLRLHSPFVMVIFTCLLWLGLCRLFDFSRWQQILVLVVLGVQESLVYQASMVRTELYSVFYWSVGVGLIVLAAKAGSRRKRHLFLLGSGIGLGLCFLTKLQALFYLMAIPFLLALMFSLVPEMGRGEDGPKTRKGAYWRLGLAAGNLVVFLGLGMASYAEEIVGEFNRSTESYEINPIGVLFLLVFLAILVGQVFLLVKGREQSAAFRYLWYVSVMGAGFHLAFACHFLLFSTSGLSWRYLLYDYKMLFIRGRYSETLSVWGYLGQLWRYFRQDPTGYLILVGFNGAIVLGAVRKWVAVTKKQLVLTILLTLVVLGHVAVGTRNSMKDDLWREIILIFVSLLYFGILVSRAVKYQRWLAWGSGVAMALLLLVNSVHAYDMSSLIDSAWHRGGWQREPWKGAFFKQGNQVHFDQIVEKKYDAIAVDTLQWQSGGYREIKRAVKCVVKDQVISMRNAGIVLEGQPVWRSFREYRMVSVPEDLRGAIVVDDYSQLRERGDFLAGKSKSGLLGKLNKHRTWPGVFSSLGRLGIQVVPSVVSFMGRDDLEVLVFVQEADVSGLVAEGLSATTKTITLNNGEETIELYGLGIEGYYHVPISRFSKRFFFVIAGVTF